MSQFTIKKAVKSQAKLRLALIGVSGSGKTYSALSIAKGLGDSILVIDTEHGSASKYAGDVADFDTLELDNFNPQNYIEAIHAGEQEGYDVIIIDSLSHAWSGRGGALEMVDNAAKRSQGNSFGAWRDVTPLHNDLIDAMLRCRAHLIATMRAKQEYIVETNSKGRQAPRKVGMGAVQRDGMEYEFDVVGDLDGEHNLMITKSRCPGLDGQVLNKPGDKFAATLKSWLSDGVVPAPVIVPASQNGHGANGSNYPHDVDAYKTASPAGGIDGETGQVYCDCNQLARYATTPKGSGWLCHFDPKQCNYRLKDTGQSGLVRPKDESQPEEEEAPRDRPKNPTLFVDQVPIKVIESEEFSEFMEAVNDVGLTLKSTVDGDKFLDAASAKTGQLHTAESITASEYYEFAGLVKAGELTW